MNGVTEIEEIRHEYNPRGACFDVFHSREKEVLISGPAGTGKSRACLEKLYAMCLLNPGTRALILRKTLTSLGSSALATWRAYVIKEALEVGYVHFYGGSPQEPPQYRFKNGSTVVIGGLDKPTRIMSSEYDVVYIQEATEITIEDLDMVNTRLRNWRITFQQLIMDCNPDSEEHMLYKRCLSGKCKLLESKHEDNPMLFDRLVRSDGTVEYKVTDHGREYIAKLDNLSGVRYKRLRLGLWVSAEGAIFEEFSPALHVLNWDTDDQDNRLPLPYDWPRYWVVDFGYKHPFVWQCWAEDDDGTLYMYREIYRTEQLIEEHAAAILACVTRIETTTWYNHIEKKEFTREEVVWTEPTPVAVICDHDAQGRATLERHLGIGTQPADKDVSTGLDLVKARLKPTREGYAGVYFMADSVVHRDMALKDAGLPSCTVEEFSSYAYKRAPDGRLTEEPVKRYDDGLDCTRYMIMHRDSRGSARATMLEG